MEVRMAGGGKEHPLAECYAPLYYPDHVQLGKKISPKFKAVCQSVSLSFLAGVVPECLTLSVSSLHTGAPRGSSGRSALSNSAVGALAGT